MFKIKYRVGNDDMKCVPSAFANVLHILGCADIAKTIMDHMVVRSNSADCTDVMRCLHMCEKYYWYKTIDPFAVPDEIRHSKAGLFGLVKHFAAACSMPMILVYGGSQVGHTHCVGIFRHQIIDGLYTHTFPLTRANLNYTLGDHEQVCQVLAIYYLWPVNKKIAKLYLDLCGKEDDFKFDFEAMQNLQKKKRKRWTKNWGRKKQKRN